MHSFYLCFMVILYMVTTMVLAHNDKTIKCDKKISIYTEISTKLAWNTRSKARLRAEGKNRIVYCSF